MKPRDFGCLPVMCHLRRCGPAVSEMQTIDFLEEEYIRKFRLENPDAAAGLSRGELREAALKLLSREWEIPFDTFYSVKIQNELAYPLDMQSWMPPVTDRRYRDFLKLKQAYREHYFTPGVIGSWLDFLTEHGIRYDSYNDVFPAMNSADPEVRRLWEEFKAKTAPAAPAIPFALRAVWYRFLESEFGLKVLGLEPGESFTVETYNRLAGTAYATLYDTPFPLPRHIGGPLRRAWERFVESRYPLRLVSLEVTPELEREYRQFLKQEIKFLKVANELLGREAADWNGFKLTSTAPEGVDRIELNRQGVWLNFVKQLPAGKRILASSESAWQAFLLKKYGSLEKINAAHHRNYSCIEEAFPAFADAYAVTFGNFSGSFKFAPLFENYSVLGKFLLLNANAVPVTLTLILLSLFCTVTFNPVAAYALSRFRMRHQDKILLLMLATMAFPAMVSAIPAYLLMRDLGMLNTFLALVLPGAANGMTIFILKGFFDSLPQELFEAATIDGANEFQIFRIVAMPLVKPIIAIKCLEAFIAAYNGWEWALIICQQKNMWTIAVWLYQANIWWTKMPWLVSAGFVLASIPTLLVFLCCQKVILRGIIIPTMK